jgi:heterodisulfide reductase subunit C
VKIGEKQGWESKGVEMASQPDKNDVVRVDFAFKRELAEKVEGDLASYCYQCGACVGDCPAMERSTLAKSC